MNKLIDPTIKKAICALVASKSGGQSDIAKLTGISQKQISNYVSGLTHSINQKSWDRLYPLLQNHLPAQYAMEEEKQKGILLYGSTVSRKKLIDTVIQDGRLEKEAKLTVIDIINQTE